MTLETLPQFHVWCPAYGQGEDDVDPIPARDAAHAAARWAEHADRESADYSIAGGEEVVVHVRDADGTRSTFSVTGESVPQYYATPYEEDQ